ncbi:transporter substrate-binding domain-containing protein [Anaerostipes faecalis]|uniref:transporter substrate-binding domain-containing protein n=1 Tax=Anaerostipes faecalis TaxID=2738446 RepID=UPI003EFED972
MKKIIASLMMITLVLSLSGCNMPWKKQETQKEEKKQVIEASKVEGTMKGMKLKIAVSDEMPPFSFYNTEKKEITGFDIDLIEKVSEYLGFEYELYPMHIGEMMQKIQDGDVDLAIGAVSITDDRQKDFSFTDAYYENSLKIMVNRNTGIKDRKEIEGKVIGVEKGMTNAQYVQDYMSENNKIKYYDSMEQVFKDLEKGKIDVTLYDSTGVDYYLVNNEKTNLEALDEKLNSEESNYGIMFKKGYEYLDQFNVALQVLNTNGEYQKLKENWLKDE